MPTPPRAPNIRTFPTGTIAQVLYDAADLREQLDFCRETLFLDDHYRLADQSEATQASTQGCIRIAASRHFPHHPDAAHDLRWHACTAFQDHIRGGIQYYDLEPSTTKEKVARDLRIAAQHLSDRLPPVNTADA